MQRTKTIWLFAFLFLSISFAFGQKVRFDYDKSANFAKYKTFMWIKKPLTPKDPFMQQRIIDSVNAQMMAKGLRLVDSNADLAVAVNVATQQKQTLNTFYDGFGGWGWGMGGVETVENYTEGTMVVDFFDTQTKKIVWRGTAEKEISSKPQKVTNEAEKAIEKLFKHFPPIEA